MTIMSDMHHSTCKVHYRTRYGILSQKQPLLSLPKAIRIGTIPPPSPNDLSSSLKDPGANIPHHCKLSQSSYLAHFCISVLKDSNFADSRRRLRKALDGKIPAIFSLELNYTFPLTNINANLKVKHFLICSRDAGCTGRTSI